jgi:hypothetical protein
LAKNPTLARCGRERLPKVFVAGKCSLRILLEAGYLTTRRPGTSSKVKTNSFASSKKSFQNALFHQRVQELSLNTFKTETIFSEMLRKA